MKAVMVMFDSLNRHYLPNYGCDWIKAPNFERLGKRCTTFDNFYAGSMPCMPARRELHTGRYNFLHRSWGPLEPFDESMPEILKNNGIYTHLVTDHFHYFEDGGATYHGRYSTWEGIRGQQGDPCAGKVADPDIPECENPRQFNLDNWRQDWVNRETMEDESDQPMPRCFESGLSFIRKNNGEDNWFLQLETFDPHEPFFSPDAYKALYPHDYQGAHYDWINYGKADEEPGTVEHIKMEYASLVSMCDHYLGQVLDLFDELNLWSDTMLIVNTDHGLMLGEKEWYGKNIQPFYDEISHVPLFIHDPRDPRPDERRDSLVQTIDIAPTLLGYFNVDIPETMQGQSLAAVVQSDDSIREAGLFGIHGGHVNVVNDDYVYMRANVTEGNTPLNEYTLMPTHMRDRFSIDELQGISVIPGGHFPSVACDMMKIPVAPLMSPDIYGHLLFDRRRDPQQVSPLDDPETELTMARIMIDLMVQNEAPDEQYRRLGLGRRGKLRIKDLKPDSPKRRRRKTTRKPLTMDSSIGRWMDDERGKVILKTHLGDFSSHPMFKMVKNMNLARIQAMSKGKISDEVLAAIEKDLVSAP